MVARRPHWPVLILLFVVTLAAALRFWQLVDLPPGLYHDEAYYGLDALSLLRGETFPQFYEGWELYANDAHAEHPAIPTRFPVFFEGNYGREPLHVYLISLSLRIFGNTPVAIRAVSAAMGTLAVLTTWLAARGLFPPGDDRLFHGELLPLLAAFSLAVLYPAVTFSRFGIRAMTMLPPTTLAVFAFWRGWHDRSKAWMTLAGFFIGLSLYTFASARLFPLIFILFGGYLLLADREGLRERLRELSLAMMAALLTAAPLLIFFIRNPYFFFFRIAYVANRGGGVVEGSPALTWLMNIGRVIGGLFWRGDTHLRHNLPGRPYLDPVQASLVFLGLIRGLRFRRHPEYVFLILWFGVMLFPSILSGDAPHFGRLVGVAPAAAILIAVGGVWLAEAVSPIAPNRWITPTVMISLCAASLLLTTRDYFGRYADNPDLAGEFYQADWDLGLFAAQQPPETVLYLSPSQEEMATIYFALADPNRLRSFNGEEGLIPAGVPERPAVYLIRPTASQTLANLQAYFPEGSTGEPADGFIPFSVPPGIERVRTKNIANADFGGIIRLVGYEIKQVDDELLITLAWQATAEPSIDYTGFVHLLGPDGALVAQTDRPPAGYPTSDWRLGEVVIDHFRIDLPPGLPPGANRLETGFYDSASLARLGEAADLGEIGLP